MIDDSDQISSRLAAALAELSEAQARRLLIEATSRACRRASGLRVMLTFDALLACARDGRDFSSPAGYECWRHAQPHPGELPSAGFIAAAFENRWSAALVAAGLPIKPGRRAQQRNSLSAGYAREALEDALGRWLRETDGGDLTYRAYEAWAREHLSTHPDDALPLSAPTFRAQFGSWQRAVAHSLGEPTATLRRGRDVRSNYSDDELKVQLAQAAQATGLGAKLTRAAYDDWSRTTVTGRGARPAHSETLRRRFGSWAAALAAASLDP